LNQDVCHRGGKPRSFGDCAKVTLALAAGNLNKIAIRQLGRTSQNRTGDIDLIVTSKTANDAAGRIVDGCESCAELCKRPGLHLLDQVSEHVVEYADLFRVETRCIAEIQVGYAPENFRAPIARACGENLLEFVDNGRGLRHFLSWAGFFLPPFTE
jgi:hypothetical protein